MNRIKRRSYRLSLCFAGSSVKLRYENGNTTEFKLSDPKTGTLAPRDGFSDNTRVRAFLNGAPTDGPLVIGERAVFLFGGDGYFPTPKLVEIIVNGQVVAGLS